MLHNLTRRLLGACLGLSLGIVPASAQQSGDGAQANTGKNASAGVPDDSVAKTKPVGSPYVELDSWIYPAIGWPPLATFMPSFLGCGHGRGSNARA